MIMRKSAFILGMGVLLAGHQAPAHGHHHGIPLTEMEQRRVRGALMT